MSTDIHEVGDITLTRYAGNCGACHRRGITYQVTSSNGYVGLCATCLLSFAREAQKDYNNTYAMRPDKSKVCTWPDCGKDTNCVTGSATRRAPWLHTFADWCDQQPQRGFYTMRKGFMKSVEIGRFGALQNATNTAGALLG